MSDNNSRAGFRVWVWVPIGKDGQWVLQPKLYPSAEAAHAANQTGDHSYVVNYEPANRLRLEGFMTTTYTYA